MTISELDAWRALVDKELAGAPFDKLVQRTAEGLALQPLYVDGPALPPVARGGDAVVVCMRVASEAEAREELDSGAEALWLAAPDAAVQAFAAERGAPVIVGEALVAAGGTRGRGVSTLRVHEAGADAADELAFALASLVVALRGGDAGSVWLQVAVGRDTFGELCKLRALRVLVAKIYAAAGLADALPPIHAVCSSRTASQRDPWVNLLRVTTQVFAATLGGARYVTPVPFDDALGGTSAHGRRVARNTALVLRDESHLGRVADAAGGSYYLETRTDQLAREAWTRFQAIERAGGIGDPAVVARFHDGLAAAWRTRAAAIAKRKEPVLGVSEFANLDERLPMPVPAATAPSDGLPRHRDAEAFEALRDRFEVTAIEVLLVPLGTPADARARIGFATALFATAGVRAREATVADALVRVPAVVCLCGSDDDYARHAVSVAAELRGAGAVKLALAGRPGALEAALRDAGVGTFLFLGCDALATLTELLS